MTADFDAMMGNREQAWLLVSRWLPEVVGDEEAKKLTTAFLMGVLSAAEASYRATLNALLQDLPADKLVDALRPYVAPDQPFMRDYLKLMKVRANAALAQNRFETGFEPEYPPADSPPDPDRNEGPAPPGEPSAE